MYLIFGRISNQTIVERGTRTDSVDIEKLKEAVAANNALLPSDLYAYTLADSDPVVARIKAGDEWSAVWLGNTISSISFSVYDSKERIRFNTDKTEITANGTDTCKITVRLVSSADADITPDVTGVYIPVQSPLGIVTKKVDIVAGLVRFDFGTPTPGLWYFPANGVKVINGYRIKNQVTINALLA